MVANYVVVWDPEDVYWEGSIVDAAQALPLKARGVCLLPCDPKLFKRSGIGGYMRRGWGAGWPLDQTFPTLFCPLTIWASPTHRRIEWAARLLPIPSLVARAHEAGLDLAGMIRLTNDSTQSAVSQAAMSPGAPPIDGRSLRRTDEHGGWTVGGSAAIHPVQDGHYGFALYGSLPGVRVAWAAITVLETPS